MACPDVTFFVTARMSRRNPQAIDLAAVTCMARPLQHSGQALDEVAKIPMKKNCEVVGWLHVDEDGARELVRESNGRLSLQSAKPDKGFGHTAIQTGAFRRANPIFDPVTSELLGYEMESVKSAIVRLV